MNIRILVSLLAVFTTTLPVVAQSNIKVYKRLLSNNTFVDATASSQVAVNNTARTVTITADSDATDWFVRQNDVAESIESITFTADPPDPATVYKVTVGTQTTWIDDETAVVNAGCSSLTTFFGVGQAATSPKKASYYVKARIGVSDLLYSVQVNEIVRVDADRIHHPEGFGGAQIVTYGRCRLISAGEMYIFEFGNRSRGNNTPTAAYDPELDIPWPYNGSEAERSQRWNVDMLTTQQSIHTSSATDGNIQVNISNHEPIPGNISDVRARGTVTGKIEAYGRISRVEGWQGVGPSPLWAGKGGEFLIAGKVSSLGVAEAGAELSGAADYMKDFSNADTREPEEGKLRLVRAVKFGSQGGNMSARLRLKALEPTTAVTDRVQMDGVMTGEIEFVEELPANKLVLVAGQMDGSGFADSILFPVGGLKGQVIVNQSNTSQTWTGAVSVDVDVLGPVPEYVQLSAPLGGGAVGEAPFRVHNEDCDPPYVDLDSDTLLDPAELCTSDFANGCPIRVRYYGPVFKNTGSTGDWLTYNNGGGTVGVAAAYTLPSGDFNRDVLIDGFTLLGGRTYTFNPGASGVSNPLRCRFVTGQPAVADESYVFTARSCSPADVGSTGGVIGSDGVLDNNDFVAFIDLYFASDPVADMGSVGGVPPGDGVFDNNDFIVFIDYFFAGSTPCGNGECLTEPRCTPPGNIMGGGEGGGDHLMSGAPAQDRAALLRTIAESLPEGPQRDLLLEIVEAIESLGSGSDR